MSTGLAYKLRLADSFGMTLGGLLLTAALAAGVLVAIVMLAIIAIGRPIGRTTCGNWSSETGVRTKFVILNPFDTGTCLAQTPDGRWVQNSKWTAFVTATQKAKP